MELGTMIYEYQGTKYEGFFGFKEKQKKRPVILVFHAWRGRDSFVDEKVKMLAEQGYFAVAIDLYGKGVLGRNEEECAKFMRPFIENRKMILEITKSAIQQLADKQEADLNQMAAIGFCFGGLCALDMARGMPGLKGAISFHGLLNPFVIQKKIHAKILVLHGLKDTMVRRDDVLAFEKEMLEAKADFQIHIYGNAMHAFTNPIANDPSKGVLYDQISSKRAFLSMDNFLKEIFTF